LAEREEAGGMIVAIKDKASKELRVFKEIFGTKSGQILLSIPVLLTLYRYYGSTEFFDKILVPLFQGNVSAPLLSVLFFFFSSFFFLFAVPIFIITVVLKERLGQYGLGWGDKKVGFALMGVLFPLVAVFLLLPASRLPAFLSEYPLFRQAGERISILILYELCYGFYYLAWEFFFRGYMLFGMKDIVGSGNSILIQTIPSTLMHIGKPDGEIWASILAGLVFGAIALRTRSILYVFLLHWCIGVTLDVFILLNVM
jgi:membrane protease YdiL (CAAX protease family)